MKLLFGSYNKHKAEEVISIIHRLGDAKFEIVTPYDLSDIKQDVEETGKSLIENAEIKARAFYERFGVRCFADDTGLEVEALGGKPGVYSARYSGEDGNDASNRAKLISDMSGFTNEKRNARFRTVICFYNGVKTMFAEGECKGRIITEERGANGFGYDSIFLPDGYDFTMAELEPDQKNKLSHRAKALANFAIMLNNL